MGTPKISVILPTYNRAHLLPRAITSVLNQSFGDFELIIVDDASSDNTRSVVEQFKDERIFFCRASRNGGDAAARNLGISLARGEWLAFQDSDDEWLLEKLEKQIRYAETLPRDFAAVGSTLLRYTGRALDSISWQIRGHSGVAHGEVDRMRFIAGFSAYLQSMLVRRSAFDEIGVFDTRLKARSDFEFCLRLSRQFRMAALMDPLVLSYETSSSISLRHDYRAADIRYILEQHSKIVECNRKAAASYWYDLSKSEALLGNKRAASAALLKAIKRQPAQFRAWALLALLPFGARFVSEISAIAQNFGNANKLN